MLAEAMLTESTDNKLLDIVRLAEKTHTYESLVHGLIAREPTAASRFHRLFGRRINALVWRMLGRDVDHDDVVQQVYVNVLTSIQTLRDPELLESWVNGVTINTVRRELHRRKRSFRIKFVEEYLEHNQPSIDPEPNLILRKFYAILAKMRTDERIVFSLYALEGYSLAEIASLCRFSVPTAKRRLKSARKTFVEKTRARPRAGRTGLRSEERHEFSLGSNEADR